MKTLETRDYQQNIVSKTIKAFEDGTHSVVIESAVGSGKTIMGMLIADHMQREHNIGIGWVTMRKNLLLQGERAFNDFGFSGLGVKFISMFDKNPPTHDEYGRKIDLVFLDEGHHDAASSMSNIYAAIKPKYVCGLSATPYRTDNLKMSFGKTIRDAGICELSRRGYLSRYNQYIIDSWTPENVAQTYIREQQLWGQSVVFFHKREDCEKCINFLVEAGIPTEFVHSEDDPKLERREAQFARFESGATKVLVNMGILTEGFDAPHMKSVFVRDSVKGPTIQMAGRVLRKHPDIEIKNIVQSNETKYSVVRLVKPRKKFVSETNGDQHVWLQIGNSKNIDIVGEKMIKTLASIDVTLPSVISKNKPKTKLFF